MIEWDGRELWKYEYGKVVSGIPAGHFDKDGDMRAYIKRQEKHDSWKTAITGLLKDFDPDRFEPLYYCQKCRRIEDGSHRFHIAKLKDMKTLSVRIGEECFKRIRPVTKYAIFEYVMKQTKGIGIKDYKWLAACSKDKWPHLSGIDFKDKTYLDVGCNVGYSCIEANKRGSGLAVGIDIRHEVIEVARSVQNRLNISFDCVKFATINWQESEFIPFHIVSCMGLVHYFPVDTYHSALAKLARTCRETLILELRIVNSGADKLIDKAGQTLPTSRWLTRTLGKWGFKIKKRVVRGLNRELWIAERGET